MTILAQEAIEAGETSLGIEFGSTRIKAVLIDKENEILGVGTHDWESHTVDGVWTYGLDDAVSGMQKAYAALAQSVREKHGVELTKIGYLGFSALMHGYLATDANGELLVPFRTYRNVITGEAARALTEELGINIPQRWSIAHLYQAVLNNEEHLDRLDSITTLAGYIHRLLSGENILGVGDASGVFPIAQKDYDADALAKVDAMIGGKYSWKVRDVLPDVRVAGQQAGSLTPEGANILDPTGTLAPGAAMCPPEGDAGTGMIATNSVEISTGNVSVGTSVFASIVLDKPLASAHEELDPVTTPDGEPVAMVHCINGTGVFDAWVKMFAEVAQLLGADVPKGKLYDLLCDAAAQGDPTGGGIVSVNYLGGEHVTNMPEGRPLLVRDPEADFSLANLMRVELMSLYASLRLGINVLIEDEGIQVKQLNAHGGIFKSPGSPAQNLANAINRPIIVSEAAGEGGAWGIAILANYLRPEYAAMPLSDFLNVHIFHSVQAVRTEPVLSDAQAFDKFLDSYRGALEVERAAVTAFPRE